MAISLKTKKLVGMVLIFLVVMAASFFLVNGKVLDRLQLQVSALLYQTRQSAHPIVIVGVDQQTTDVMGATATWTRDNYAQAIRNLSKYNPAVIGLDYFFTTQSKVIPTAKLTEILSDTQSSADVGIRLGQIVGKELNQYDQALADEVKTNPKLVMTYPPMVDFSEKSLIEQNFQSNQPFAAFKPDERTRIGLINVLLEADGSVRKYIPVIEGSENYLSFALATIGTYFGGTEMRIESYSPTSVEIDFGKNKIKIPLINYQFLINFSVKPFVNNLLKEENSVNKSINYIHFKDAFNNNFSDIDTSSLAGAIVLIGPYVQNNDNYKVPIDNDYRMSGVQIHAEAIQTILDQAWLRDMNLFEVMGTVALTVLLSLLLIFNARMILALLGLVVIEGLYTAVLGPWAFRQGLIVNLIYPPLAVLMAAIVGYAYRFVTEFGQKTRAAVALRQYVNAGVEERVLESSKVGVEKSGVREEITVIFTDIRGFTTISENLQPQSLVALLNEYFEVMAAEVVKYGGIVDKYEGDALMAFFEGSDDAVNAARAALGMRAALPKLLDKWRKDPPLPGGEKKPEIDFRVGLSSGEAVVGNFGSSQHIQYTAMGDIVNLGSRLEGANKTYQTNVMISEATFQLIKDQFECRFIDFIKVKGKNKPIKVYQLLAERGQLSPDDQALVLAYNKGLQLYFDWKFAEAAEYFEKEVLTKWPNDYLCKTYAGRSQKNVFMPPPPNWDFVYEMQSK